MQRGFAIYVVHIHVHVVHEQALGMFRINNASTTSTCVI